LYCWFPSHHGGDHELKWLVHWKVFPQEQHRDELTEGPNQSKIIYEEKVDTV
jgi:hypothetical protein